MKLRQKCLPYMFSMLNCLIFYDINIILQGECKRSFFHFFYSISKDPFNVCKYSTYINACNLLKEMGMPDHLTCLLRNLYAGQEATVRTGHGKTDWLQMGKGVRQDCILSPYLFNLYAEFIMRNAGLDEEQAGIKIAGRNINNLRYAEDTNLMAESEEE